MPKSYFADIPQIQFEGAASENPLAYRYYDKNRVVLGKRMEDHLRMAVCYWHSFCNEGADMFGPGTFHRPWNSGQMDQGHAELKLNDAFEFFTRLGLPYFCFHDTDGDGRGEDDPRTRGHSRGSAIASRRRWLQPE